MKIIPLAFMLVMGCASTKHAARETGDTLASAYHSVATGVKETARSGAYTLSRAGHETVRVMKEAPAEMSSSVSDGWITTKVKSKLGFAREVKATDVNVVTDAGVVTLKGVVKSESEAMKAIEETLDTNGVVAVDSQLQWPTQRAGSKIYVNEPARE